jgi:hypothetical protein
MGVLERQNPCLAAGECAWWLLEASPCALTPVAAVPGQWYKWVAPTMFPTFKESHAFILPLMPVPDFKHVMS